MIISFVKDIEVFLNQIHIETAHRGRDALRNALLEKNIYYKGIISDINSIINKCTICNLKNNKPKLLKADKYKLVIFDRPKERYIGDLTSIPIEFINNTNNIFYEINKGYKYIFAIVDHFSKFCDCYLLKDKKQNSILKALKNFIDFYGKPKEFGCDNGREFVNSVINKYLKDNHIIMINGRPYNPRAQGAVERIHITIRNSLLSMFLENINKFNLENSLVRAVNIYNKTIHRITKHTPNEIFYSSNEDFFKLIINNILDNYNKANKTNLIFKEQEKILLINNIVKTKQKTKSGNIILTINKVKKKNLS